MEQRDGLEAAGSMEDIIVESQRTDKGQGRKGEKEHPMQHLCGAFHLQNTFTFIMGFISTITQQETLLFSFY